MTGQVVPIVTVGNWTAIGPHHINGQFGESTSGRLQALAIFPGDTNIMYAGGGIGSGFQGPVSEAGAFKTTDGGVHWMAINNGLIDPMVNALWVSQSDANTALAGTEFGGIFKTTDGGQTWVGVRSGSASEFVSANAMVYAATSSGILQSNDLGSTWTTSAATASTARVIAASGTVMIAGLDNGSIMMQAAPGAAWQTVMTNAGHQVWAVAIDQLTATTAFAVLSPGSVPQGSLVVTTDGGSTWRTAAVPNTYNLQSLATVTATHTLYVGSSPQVYKTTDAGQTFAALANSRWDNHQVFVVPGQSALIVASDQGLHETNNDGATWSDLSVGMLTSILYGVSVRGSTILTAVQDFSPLLSFDGGNTWQQPVWTQTNPPVGEDGQVLIHPGNAAYCYAFTVAGYQYSTDFCRTFRSTGVAALSGVTYVQPGGINIVAVDVQSSSTVYAAASAGVFKSTDWGVTMNATNWPLVQPTAIAVDPTDGRTIFVGTTTKLYRSQDGGTTWTELPLAGAAGHPTTIAIDPNNPQTILVGLSSGPGSGGGVLRSVDGGSTFRLVNTGLSSVVRNFICCGVDVFSVRFSASSIAALATGTGIYVSANFGDTWQNVTGTSVPSFFTDVAWDSGFLYASTIGQGVLRAAVRVIGSSDSHMSLDTPASGSSVGPSFTVAGWAADLGAGSGTGVDAVHVWAFPSSGSPVFVGAATYGIARSDIGAVFGSQFTNSGFALTASLPAGTYTLVAYAHSTLTGTFNQQRTATITVVPPVSNPRMAVDVPTTQSAVGSTFTLTGWAVDLAASSGAGVDYVDGYAYPIPNFNQPVNGAPIFLGRFPVNGARSDIGGFFGSQFTTSGFSGRIVAGTLAPAKYRVYVYAHSLVSLTFNNFSAPVDIAVGATASDPVMFVDQPVTGATLTAGQPFTVSGWALDRGASSGAGIFDVHVWAFPTSGSPFFLWSASSQSSPPALGLSRPDIGAAYGSQFVNAGYSLNVPNGIAQPGTYNVYVFTFCTLVGASQPCQARITPVTVR